MRRPTESLGSRSSLQKCSPTTHATTHAHTTHRDRRRHNHRNQNIGMVATSVALLVLLLIDSTATLSARSAAPRRRRACVPVATRRRMAISSCCAHSCGRILECQRRSRSARHECTSPCRWTWTRFFCEILLGSADRHHSTFLEVDDCNQEDAAALHFAVAGMRCGEAEARMARHRRACWNSSDPIAAWCESCGMHRGWQLSGALGGVGGRRSRSQAAVRGVRR